MPRIRNQSLGGRADQAGILFAAANAPLGFQRTLMPRGVIDQALVTGLSASANHALVSLVQETMQSAALVLAGQGGRRTVDEQRWSRAALDRRLRGDRRRCRNPTGAARVPPRTVATSGRARSRLLARDEWDGGCDRGGAARVI